MVDASAVTRVAALVGVLGRRACGIDVRIALDEKKPLFAVEARARV
jgi:hypothetical protein